MKSKLFSLIILAAAALPLTGCGTSKSYQAGVGDLYPVVADRLDRYSPGDEVLQVKVQAVRDAAVEPVTYPKASAAWREVAPDYTARIGSDPSLSDFRRTEWLLTGQKLDELNAAESKRRQLLFLPP